MADQFGTGPQRAGDRRNPPARRSVRLSSGYPSQEGSKPARSRRAHHQVPGVGEDAVREHAERMARQSHVERVEERTIVGGPLQTRVRRREACDMEVAGGAAAGWHGILLEVRGNASGVPHRARVSLGSLRKDER